MQESTERIAIVRLGTADAAAVEDLFVAAQQRVELGFLARRAPGEYARLLLSPDAVAVGAKAGETLVGYSACYRIEKNPYPAIAFLRHIDARRSVVYHGSGTVISPPYEGRMLARRLFQARHQELVARGLQHFLGLIAVGNWLSIGNALYSGGILVGLAHDDVALNYVAYSGELKKALAPGSHASVDWGDLDAHRQMFDTGCVVSGLETPATPAARDSRLRHFVFSLPGGFDRKEGTA